MEKFVFLKRTDKRSGVALDWKAEKMRKNYGNAKMKLGSPQQTRNVWKRKNDKWLLIRQMLDGFDSKVITFGLRREKEGKRGENRMKDDN